MPPSSRDGPLGSLVPGGAPWDRARICGWAPAAPSMSTRWSAPGHPKAGCFEAARSRRCSRSGNWEDVGHYTQMIWPGSVRVGCAIRSSASNDYLVCRYSPAGNVMGAPSLNLVSGPKTSLKNCHSGVTKLYSGLSVERSTGRSIKGKIPGAPGEVKDGLYAVMPFVAAMVASALVVTSTGAVAATSTPSAPTTQQVNPWAALTALSAGAPAAALCGGAAAAAAAAQGPAPGCVLPVVDRRRLRRRLRSRQSSPPALASASRR